MLSGRMICFGIIKILNNIAQNINVVYNLSVAFKSDELATSVCYHLLRFAIIQSHNSSRNLKRTFNLNSLIL